jgi:4-hydroxybenzoate polyprenyltransferase
MAIVLFVPTVDFTTVVLMVFFSIAGSLAYMGGMFLNDAFDANFDREHQPFRPIPSGEIQRSTVFILGFGLLLLSFACFSFVQIDYYQNPRMGTSGFFLNFRQHFFICAAALYGSIIVYNVIHKATALSVIFMALARASLILVVVSAMMTAMFLPALIAAGVHFVYVCSLTIVARLEAQVSVFKGKIPYLIAGISALDAILVGVFKQNFVVAAILVTFVFLTLQLQKCVKGTYPLAVMKPCLCRMVSEL